MTIRLFRENGAGVHLEWYPKVASTAFAFDDLVYIDASGFLTPAIDGAGIVPTGLIQKTVALTDTDIADNTRVPVLVAAADAEYLCDVSTGTAAQTDVGEEIDIDDANSVDVNASTYDVFLVTQVISTSLVIAKLLKKSGVAV